MANLAMVSSVGLCFFEQAQLGEYHGLVVNWNSTSFQDSVIAEPET